MRCGHGLALFELSVISVFLRPGQGVTFHLSGVGELRPTHYISLPRDENEMILWNHRSRSQHASAISNFVSRREYPKAFPIHERCWQLMTRILDADVIKRNMDSFVPAMFNPNHLTRSRRWSDPILVSPEVRAVLGCTAALAPRFHPTTQKFRSIDAWKPNRMTRGFLGTDPLNDSYIKSVIAKYTAKYTSQREKGCEPMSQPSIPTHTMFRRSQATFKTRNVFLPTELILNIADHLEHQKDIRALLSAFPHWFPMIPDSYWRRRFIEDNHLESNHFPATDALDWQHVYLHSDRLPRPSFGWRNRQHILSQLEGVKDRFLRRLKQKGIQE
ncbi:hypothetical protein N7527_010393 [Penicillium freii]|nr:hypothetical protein N7527_010393 [Penicillium freii]